MPSPNLQTQYEELARKMTPCPCLIGGRPCSDNCNCAKPYMSTGCKVCGGTPYQVPRFPELLERCWCAREFNKISSGESSWGAVCDICNKEDKHSVNCTCKGTGWVVKPPTVELLLKTLLAIRPQWTVVVWQDQEGRSINKFGVFSGIPEAPYITEDSVLEALMRAWIEAVREPSKKRAPLTKSD